MIAGYFWIQCQYGSFKGRTYFRPCKHAWPQMKIYGPKLEPRSKLGHEKHRALKPENSEKVRTLMSAHIWSPGSLAQSVPKTIALTGHLGQWQALIYWPKPGFTGPNNWHNTMSTKFPHASRASGRALFTGPIGNWLANGVGPVLISQTAGKLQ